MVVGTTGVGQPKAPARNVTGDILESYFRLKDNAQRLARSGVRAGGRKALTAKARLKRCADNLASAAAEAER